MADERFEDHLRHPRGRGREVADAFDGAAGGAACGDLVRVSVAVEGDRVRAAGFEASGCGATIAAASAAVELAEGAGLLEAARIGSPRIAAELGGLSPGKLHATDLASDALHRALGAAVRARGQLPACEARTLVAMSGGVDSAVAALLAVGGDRAASVARNGESSARDVAAVTLELWADPESDGERSCCSAAAVRGARRVAHGLGLPHFTLDLRDEFRAGVVEPWLMEHAAGETPNPCVRCNGHVRLDAMIDFADRLGAATLTTGHYARRTHAGLLRLAADPAKDQTYMLAALSRAALSRLRFPLGDLTKPAVRALAERERLDVAHKPDSQDLCFLAGTGRASFLARHGGLRRRPGDILDRSGAVVGSHDGHHGFTVGQRRGLGGGAREPLYVLATDAQANTVTIGPRDALQTRTVRVRGLRMHGIAPDAVRLRYRSPALRCRLDGEEIHLDEPFDGAAPGQTAVFLAGDAIVGCATIAGVKTDEIRETFLRFFEGRDHLRLPSASLVPSAYDPSVLLTTAGMHPLVPYFRGEEKPPHPRLTTVQKCFRTTDIDNVGNTTRHLTFFEMLGNFSIGDYFKQEAVEAAWELSLHGFGFKPEDIWITVFEGDAELGIGPDEEAIAAWLSVGVPLERIVRCPRSENFWQGGPTGPCGPCSELYLDRGLEWGAEDDLPGGENERFLEYWNLVFTQYDMGVEADGRTTLAPLPASNIDTGLGLERMAVIQQGVDTVFETDTFAPLMALGRELAASEPDERALRILADHSRAMTFLVADGVVPSNEARGYILRRIMRRAILQGNRVGMAPGFMATFAEQVIEVMGAAYPELDRERDAILLWARSEEEGFGRTLEQGTKLLDEVVARSAGVISGEDAFRLHDTFGFPIDLTRELAEERGLELDYEGFAALMGAQRVRSRGGGAEDAGDEIAARPAGDLRERARELAREDGYVTDFTGYETLEQPTTVGALDAAGDRVLVHLAESPFYATGGGQVADGGVLEAEAGAVRAHVTDVLRVGDDQALVVRVDEGALRPGERVVARVDRAARTATQANHTATHLLHAALRETLGTHVRQAGSYVGPDKLRFDFSHGERISPEDLESIEDRVNEWVLRNDPVRPITTTLAEARALGAMALFGEKYGDVVRMVQIGDGDYSRELCGGTHVRSTAEIGVFKLVSESSSAANVRRIEAITGSAAVAELRASDSRAREAAATLKASVDQLPRAVTALRQQVKDAAKAAASSNGAGTIDADALAASSSRIAGADVVAEVVSGVASAKDLPDLADRIKGKLSDESATVLGTVVDGRVHLVAAVTPALVARGVKAGAIVKAAAQVAGGGGGGRDTMAQAGGKDPAALPDAIAAARAAIAAALTE